MEEMIDVLDEKGNKTGKVATRATVHREGLCHRIIVVAIVDKEGRLLMQQRAMQKESNPGKWDVSTAGHVSTGQTSMEAAIREVEEEIGIKLKEQDLHLICTFHGKGQVKENYIANHIYDFYLVRKERIDMTKIKKQESEVAQIKLVTKQEVESLIQQEQVVKRGKVYSILMEYLK